MAARLSECRSFISQVTGLARQKVRPAMQLLSSTSALAMRRYMGKEEEARFLRVVDEGFDVLNSAHPKDVKPLRRGYSGQPEQEAALTELVKETTAMRIGKARHLYPFQKGILVTVKSVRGLLADVRSRYGADTYLLTRHLTQDRLEGFFGMVRGCGGSNSNPTPTEAKSRLRLLTILMLTQHGVSPLCEARRSPPATAEAITEPVDSAVAGQVAELCRECDGEELPDEIARLAARTPVWMGAMTKVVAVYDHAFWREEGLAGAAFSHSGPMREVHDMSGPDGQPAALFGFAPSGPTALTRVAIVDQLGALFGDRARDPLALHINDWQSEQWTSPDGPVA